MIGPYDRDVTMQALLRALPYIRLYKGKVFVVKLGGALCAETEVLREVAEQLAVLHELGIRVVLVHGAGPQTTELEGRLGIPSRVVAGRRVTSEETLDVAVMTMNGSVNTAILAACRAVSLSAVGVSGVDAGLVNARRRPPREMKVEGRTETVDFGHVGDVQSVDGAGLERLLATGLVPVMSPLAADANGNVLNINADTIAARVAAVLRAEKLIFFTDAPGLLERAEDPASLVSYTDLDGLESLEAAGAIGAGMLPKVRAATDALLGGVGRVHMVGYRSRTSLLVEVFTNEGAGTLVVRDTGELRPTEQSSGDQG